MPDANPHARQQAIKYVSRLLDMNPVHQSEDIIHTRARALRLTTNTPPPDSAPDMRALRTGVLKQLEEIRAHFWSMPIAELQRRLSELPVDDLPDLAASVRRLRIVASHRSRFPALSQSKGFDGDFFAALKQVLISAPRDVALLKEQVLATFRTRSGRKRGRRMLALLRENMPAIYELEAGWFEALQRQKPKARQLVISERPSLSSSGSWWVYWLISMVAIRILTSIFG